MSDREYITKRRHRFRRISKWLTSILSAVVLVVWALSVVPMSSRTFVVQRWRDSNGFELRLGTLHLGYCRADLVYPVFGGSFGSRAPSGQTPVPPQPVMAPIQQHSYLFDIGWRTNLFYPHRDWSDYGLRLPSGSMMRRAKEFPTVAELSLPLWVLFAIITAPTTILWYRDRRYKRGHCQSCNYNLTGNTSGICPECGTSIPPEQGKALAMLTTRPTAMSIVGPPTEGER
jgi:hypothetical protein